MAFDGVRMRDILSILMEKKVLANITRTIHNLNSNNATKVEARDQLTENIPTPGGIRHGDSLSLFLFNPPMGKIIKKVTSLRLGCRMGNKRIGAACYAESENDLQRQPFQLSTQY